MIELDVHGRELLNQIVAAPEDSAARLVFADYLMSKGDTHKRGLYMRMTNEPLPPWPLWGNRGRIQALEQRYARTWLGPVARVTTRNSYAFGPRQFERGFLAHCEVHERGPYEAARGDLEWSLVKSIQIRGYRNGPVVDLLRDPALASLQSVSNLTSAMASRLLTGPRIGISSLHLHSLIDADSDPPRPPFRQALDQANAPALTRLEIAYTPLDGATWVLDTLVGSRLFAFGLHPGAGAASLLAWIDAANPRADLPLREIAIIPYAPRKRQPYEKLRAALRRGKDGLFSALTVFGLAEDSVRQLMIVLQALAPSMLTELSVTWRDAHSQKALHPQLEQALEAHTSLTRVELGPPSVG